MQMTVEGSLPLSRGVDRKRIFIDFVNFIKGVLGSHVVVVFSDDEVSDFCEREQYHAVLEPSLVFG